MTTKEQVLIFKYTIMSFNIEDYLLVKEKIHNLDKNTISMIFLDLLKSQKIDYFDITSKYIEFQKIEIDNQIDITREIANNALSLIFNPKKEFSENCQKTIVSICSTNMFNSEFIKNRLKKKLKLHSF